MASLNLLFSLGFCSKEYRFCVDLLAVRSRVHTSSAVRHNDGLACIKDWSDSYLLGEGERPPLIHAEVVSGTPNVLMTEEMLTGRQILGGLIDRR